jgi:hypothetical protein
MPGSAFVCYARREFYFAESLAAHLQDRGIPAWLDVHQLHPADDWQERIDEALDSCECAVVVASRASITSPYAAHEWRAAITRGKPVYVAQYEPVDLPQELAQKPVCNFRIGFASAADQLAGSIKAELVEQGRASGRWPFVLPFPGSVSLVAAALGLGCLGLVSGALPLIDTLVRYDLAFMMRISHVSLLIIALLQVLPSVLLTGLLAWLVVRFVRRTRTRFGEIQFCLWSLPLFGWWSYNAWSTLADYLAHDGPFLSRMAGAPFLEWILPLLLAGWALGWLAAYRMGRSEDMLRWLLPGEAPDSLRDRFAHTGVSLMRAGRRQGDFNFTLEYAPGDSRVAAHILRATPERAFVPGQARGAADYHILVLSNCLPEATLRRALAPAHGQLVCVVASNVNLPVDADVVHRYQWVDYRKRTNGTLHAMVSTLQSQASGGAPQGSHFVPESLLKPVAPSRVFRLGASLKLLTALCLAVAVAPAPDRPGTAVWDVQHVIAAALVALTFAAMTVCLLARLLTFPLLTVGLGAAWVGMLLSGVAGGFAGVFPAYDVGPLNLMALIYVVLPVGLFLWLARDLQEWLPTVPQWRPRGTARLAAIDGPVELALWAIAVVLLSVPLVATR